MRRRTVKPRSTLVLFVLALIPMPITACTSDRVHTDSARPDDTRRAAAALAIDALGDAENRSRLSRALAVSLTFFDDPLSRARYPTGGISHEHARLSVVALRALLDEHGAGGDALMAALEREFDLVKHATGDDSTPSALFTGYFTPEFAGALHRFEPFVHPLHRAPSDDRIELSRKSIETTDALRGHEIVWLADPFDAYVIHVNGSARIRLPDGSHINVAHTATNARAYTSLGRLLIDDGEIAEADMSLQQIRAWYRRNPRRFIDYAHRNERYVFFEIIEADGAFPRGLDSMPLTPMVSAAIDPSIYPPGAPLVAHTTLPTIDEDGDDAVGAFSAILVAQDVGGAIKGPGRVDLFIGVGLEAGEIAGRQIASGRLWTLLLKEGRLDHWRRNSR